MAFQPYEIRLKRLVKHAAGQQARVWEGYTTPYGITVAEGFPESKPRLLRYTPLDRLIDKIYKANESWPQYLRRALETLAAEQIEGGYDELSWQGWLQPPCRWELLILNYRIWDPRLMGFSSHKLRGSRHIAIAEIAVQKLVRGRIQEIIVPARPGTDLFDQTRLKNYLGYIVEEINPNCGFVLFRNGKELSIEESQAEDTGQQAEPAQETQPKQQDDQWGIAPPVWF